MRMPVSSRIFYAILAILMALFSHLADYNASHLFNPIWPAHEKFHDGMTLSLSIMLGLMTILFAWRKREIEYPQSSRPAGSRGVIASVSIRPHCTPTPRSTVIRKQKWCFRSGSQPH